MEIQQKNKKVRKRLIVFSIFLSVIFTLFIGCFYILSKGISVKQFKIANIELKEFYLKLDNKLILTLDKLIISKQNKQTSVAFPQAIKWFQNSLIAISYFEKIEIKNIVLPNAQKASIFYDGQQYYLSFPEVEALFQIKQDTHEINLTIQKLTAENLKFQLDGQIDYLFSQGKIQFSLVANPYGENLNHEEKLILKGDSNLKTINISAFSTPIQNLALYENEIKKIPALHTWLMQKASFDHIRIKNLFFSAPLNENFISRMIKSLYAELEIQNASLKLETHLAPITTPFLKVKFQKEVLSFDIKNPHYEGIELDGSFVELHDLAVAHKPTKTLVHIESKQAILDERIHKILKAYDIDIDINQVDSVIDISLNLAFQKNGDNLDVEAKGLLKSSNTRLNVFGTPLFAQDLKIALDITPSNSHIFINDSILQMQDPFIEGLINCNIDLKQKTLQGRIDPKLIQINASPNTQNPLEKIFELNQTNSKQISINADFAEALMIDIGDLDLKLNLGETKTILINNISKIYPYSPLLQQLDIHDGLITVQTKDFKTFAIETKINNLNYPILDKEWNPIKELQAKINVTPNYIYAKSLDESIILEYAEGNLKATLKDKNFNFQHIQDNKVPILSSKNLSSFSSQDQTSKKTTKGFSIYLESKNSAFKYKDFIVPTDEIIVNSKDVKTTLDATHKNGVLNLDFYDDIIRFSANNFSGNFVNLIAGKEIVQGGLFSAKGIYKNQILRSTVEMQNTIFKNFATLQNIVALIDTIPSLIVFKKPGFSTQGYHVKQGRISFDLNDTHLGLKRIDLVGDSIDIAGGGVITLENQELNISLTISTIKGLSDVLNKIPIVGYLLLGKEGKISTGLILTGTLKDPKSEVTIAQDILTAPFKIIERIFVPE